MSLVSIPLPTRPGNNEMFVPSRSSGDSFFPQTSTNTMGALSNDHSVHAFDIRQFAKNGWNSSFVPGSFSFVINDASKYGVKSRGQNGNRITMATLPIVNFLLGNSGILDADIVQNTIRPLGINTTSESEYKPSNRRMNNVYMNTIVQGWVEAGYNIWGSNFESMAEIYFVIKKVWVRPSHALQYNLTREFGDVEYIRGGETGKYILQLVPHVGYEPELSEFDLGSYKVGRMVETSSLRDTFSASSDVANDLEKLSRSTSDILSKTKFIRILLN